MCCTSTCRVWCRYVGTWSNVTALWSGCTAAWCYVTALWSSVSAVSVIDSVPAYRTVCATRTIASANVTAYTFVLMDIVAHADMAAGICTNIIVMIP